MNSVDRTQELMIETITHWGKKNVSFILFDDSVFVGEIYRSHIGILPESSIVTLKNGGKFTKVDLKYVKEIKVTK